MGVLGAWAVFIKALAVRLAHETHLGRVVLYICFLEEVHDVLEWLIPLRVRQFGRYLGSSIQVAILVSI